MAGRAHNGPVLRHSSDADVEKGPNREAKQDGENFHHGMQLDHEAQPAIVASILGFGARGFEKSIALERAPLVRWPYI